MRYQIEEVDMTMALC